jgi:membrane-associated phospholipid phosphatase
VSCGFGSPSPVPGELRTRQMLTEVALSAEVVDVHLAVQRFTVVVVDCAGRLKGSVKLIQGLREASASVVIVVLGAGGSTNRVAAFEAGADHCLDEPVMIDELLARIRGTLKQTLMDSRAADRSLPDADPGGIRTALQKRFAANHFLWLFGGLLLLGFLDAPVSRALLPYKQVIKSNVLAEELREAGSVWLTAILCILLLTLRQDRIRATIVLVGSAALSVLIRLAIAICVSRARPYAADSPWHFMPFTGGPRGWFHAEYLSFPSGHTTLTFATAASLAFLLPRGRWLFFTVATLVGLERVAESVHWTTDVAAGAAVGVFGFHLWNYLLRKFRTHLANRPSSEPIVAGHASLRARVT